VNHRPDRDTAAVRASLLRAVASALLILGIYAVVPVTSARDTTSVVVLAAGLVVLGGIVVVRVRQIQHAPRPYLRAAEVLALVVPLFIAVFAWAYLLLSAADPAAFSEPLNRMDAAYFTLVIISTVGFGDISATSDLSRFLVSAQIVVNFTLLAAAVRVILLAARSATAAVPLQAGRSHPTVHDRPRYCPILPIRIVRSKAFRERSEQWLRYCCSTTRRD
jgi:voltage-gated potassium channel